MDYGTSPENAADAKAWIAAHQPFGHYIDGAFTAPGDMIETRNPATGDLLAEVTQASQQDVAKAVKAARKAQPGWEKLGGPARARHLYAIARLLQKHARLFAVLEVLDTGKPIREARDVDIPLAQRHFYHHAGLAQLMEDALPHQRALGVCGQIVPWNFPLLMLAWKIAPALAMGNTVVLKPAEWTPLTALAFAELCDQAGLPNGVVNIVTGDGAVGEALVAEDVNKIAFTGSTAVGRRIRSATAGRDIALTLELGGKSPFIVCADADLDSAVEGLVEAVWFNGGQVCCAGTRLIVQEGIADQFHAKLRARMDNLRVGDPLDKSVDIGALADPKHRAKVAEMVRDCSEGETYQIGAPEGCFYPPTLIEGLSPAHPLMQEEIFGPVLVSTTFRTPDEAVALANNTRYGLAGAVWSENINVALDLAPKIAAGVVWVNGANMFDAAAPFGGVRESGFGREGGWEGARAYTKPAGKAKKPKPVAPFEGKGGTEDAVHRSAKLYIGGKQTRPDGGYSRPIFGPKGNALGQVAIGSRKDVRNAVESATGAASWGGTSAHTRAQILYYMAENLSARADEFADRLKSMTGKDGGDEVAASVDRLFTWAAWADKVDGAVKPVPMRGVAMALRKPVGVVGAVLAESAPLMALVSVLGPLMALGNRAVLVAPEAFPLSATDFIQVLETSDVPAGVVNILTGPADDLAWTLADHAGVDAVWSFSAANLAAGIEARAAGNLKRTWVAPGLDLGTAQSEQFIASATEVQTVWIPYGA